MKKDILRTALLLPFLMLTGVLCAQVKGTITPPADATPFATCGTDRLGEKLSLEDPQYAKDLQFFKEVVVPKLAAHHAENGNILTIPTVVHIIHNGEPVGQGPNLSEDRILGQIAILNQDFAALNPEFNQTPAQWAPVAGTPNIQFCLATIDPDGNPTNGIDRVQFNITGTDWQNNNIESELKPAVNWDPNHYLNIYVLAIPGTTAQGGVVGYSNYPTQFELGTATDGPVVDYNWFGAPGFGQSGYRAITHEIGHYLGLPHPFDGNSCTQDDGIADTPNVEEATSNLANLNCANTYPMGPVSCGNEHMYVNYMDYTNENCYTSFTEGQVNVMRGVLDGTSQGFGYGSRKPLVEYSAIACIVAEFDAGILEVIEPTARVCDADSIAPVVKLRNFGTENIQSVYIAYQIDDNAPDTTLWTGTLNSGSNINVTLPKFMPPNGAYTFKTYTFLPNNMTDQRMANDTVSFNGVVNYPLAAPVLEDLEGETGFPTNEGYFRVQVNPANDNFQWVIASGLSAYGMGDQCLWFNNFDGTNNANPFGSTDAIISPYFDLSGSNNTQLVFDVAYTNFDTTFSDTLLIFVSTGCSGNFDQLVYVKGGTDLATAPPSADFFIPTDQQWRTDTVDLTMFDGQPDLSIAFVNFSGWGNNLFLDNIQIGKPCAFDFTSQSENVTCAGNCDGSASIVAPPNANLTYAWSDGQTGATAAGLCPGTYQVTITDSGLCTTTAQFLIEEPPALTLSVSATNETANGANDGTATATPAGGNGGYTFLWNTGATTPQIDGLAPGTYSVTLTDAKGCETSASVVVEAVDCSGFSATASATAVSCFGENDGSALATPAGSFGPYTYMWSNGATEQQAFGLTAGTYTVTITDGLGCPFVASATVTQPDLLTAAAVATSETANGANDGTATVSFDGGTPPITAVWSNGQTGTTITNLAPGNYSVTVTDDHGCTAMATTMVNSFDCGNFGAQIVSTDISCFGANDGTAGVSNVVGTGPFSFNWSNGLNDQNLSNLPAGNYQVTVSDATDCETVLSVQISEPPALMAGLTSSDEMTNNGNDGQASVAPSGGTPPYSVLWSNNATGTSVTNLAPGNYSVTVTDAHGCEWTQSFAIAPFQCALSANLSITNATCPNSTDGTAVITVAGGTEPYLINWSNGDTGPVADGLSPGFYLVTVTDENECDLIQTFQIMGLDNENPIVQTQNITVELDADGLASVTPQMVDNNSFDNCEIAEMTLSQTDFSCDDIGVNMVLFTVTDAAGNSSSVNVQITVEDNQAPVVTQCPADIEVVNCSEIVTYDLPQATDNCGNLTMTQTTGLGSGSVFPVGETIETYTFTDAGGNTSACSFKVTLQYDLAVHLTGQNPSCAGFADGVIFVDATGGQPPYQFQFSGGGDPVNLSAGTYEVTLVDNAGCTTISSVTLNDPDPISITVGTVTAAVNGKGGAIEFFLAGGTGTLTVEFFLDGVLVPNANPIDLAPGDYVIKVTDENGCQESSQIITVENMVGTRQTTLERAVQLFPNPTDGRVFVKIDLSRQAWVEIAVMDVTGKTIEPLNGKLIDHNTFSLDLSHQPAGVYWVKVMVDDDIVTRRLVLFDF
ncbi:MAG: T9SS C-terminal target domain-containing protein [Bacteroidetes bacterium]|nr:MAG: T9SS C-terminal target domain-containing protein [Bacteroidota bacterium]